MPGLVSVTLDENSELLRNLEKFANFDQIAGTHFESAMRVAVSMGKQKVIAELVAVANQNRSAMVSEVGGDFTPLAPVSAKTPGNRISGMVSVQGPLNIVGIIGDIKKTYLRLTEGGRGPGRRPPAAKLQDWAERTLGVVPAPPRVTKKGRVIRDVSVGRALSDAIAKKGIKPSPVMEKSAREIEKHVMGLFEKELLKIAAELGYK
jgi:hypothetical protein